jgi:hypothetical protein
MSRDTSNEKQRGHVAYVSQGFTLGLAIVAYIIWNTTHWMKNPNKNDRRKANTKPPHDSKI